MTTREAYPLFIAYGRAERHYAEQTLEKLRDCFHAWLLPCLGEKLIEGLTRADVLAFRAAMVDGNLGINRQYQILMVLKLLLKFAQKGLNINCLDPNEIRLPAKPKPHVVFLNNDEVERLRNAIRIHTFTGLRMRTLIEVLLGTGLRISEALALDRTPFEVGQTQLEIIGKGGKRRTVFFPESALHWIKKFLYYRSDDCPALFVTTGLPRRLDRYDIFQIFRCAPA